MILVVMGVSGCGKTTVGKLIADHLRWPYFEGDDFHSKANIEKMSQGIPLTDEDRAGWLEAIAKRMQEIEQESKSAVFTCSALKNSYREKLASGPASIQFIYLRGDYETIRQRLETRQGHYMKAALLKSQFEILEEPQDAWVFDVTTPPLDIAHEVARVING